MKKSARRCFGLNSISFYTTFWDTIGFEWAIRKLQFALSQRIWLRSKESITDNFALFG